MFNVFEVAQNMNKFSPGSNTSLHTFINVANDTFNHSKEVSMWVTNPDVLYFDIHNMTKVVLCVIDVGEDYTNISRDINTFKEMLSIDFNVNFMVSSAPLKIPMVELWTTTKVEDVWISDGDLKVPAGSDVLVPFDYFAVSKPVLFSSENTKPDNPADNCIYIKNLSEIQSMLPYKRHIVKP